MIPKYIMQDRFRVDEVLTEDLVEGGDGAAEVFGNQVGGGPGSEGEAGVGEG